MQPITDTYFYFGIYEKGDTKRISVETNNFNIRQKSFQPNNIDEVILFEDETEFKENPTVYYLNDYTAKLMSELGFSDSSSVFSTFN